MNFVKATFDYEWSIFGLTTASARSSSSTKLSILDGEVPSAFASLKITRIVG